MKKFRVFDKGIALIVVGFSIIYIGATMMGILADVIKGNVGIIVMLVFILVGAILAFWGFEVKKREKTILYCQAVSKKAIRYVKSLNKVYITFVRATGDRIPYIGKHCYASVFSKQKYADRCVQMHPDADMFYKEFDREEFSAFMKTWYRLGISGFDLNTYTRDRNVRIDRDEVLPIEGIKKWNIVGSVLNQLIIRFNQNSAIQHDLMARAVAMTMWSCICHELFRSVFLVPFTYDDEPYDVEDWVIHTTLAAAERLTQMEIERQIGDRLGDGRKMTAADRNGNPIYSLKEDLIYGSEKYHFAGEGEGSPGKTKTMHLRTILIGGNRLLCGFTDFDSLHKAFGENVRVAVFTYEEIIAHIVNDAVSDGTAIQGFAINPGTNELILSLENIEDAAQEKDGPVKRYDISPEGTITLTANTPSWAWLI